MPHKYQSVEHVYDGREDVNPNCVNNKSVCDGAEVEAARLRPLVRGAVKQRNKD